MTKFFTKRRGIRRSLLSVSDGEQRQLSLPKLLVVVIVTLIPISILVQVIDYGEWDTGRMIGTAITIVMFTIPITIVAHYITRLINKRAKGISRGTRIALLAAGWIVSGGVGSLITTALIVYVLMPLTTDASVAQPHFAIPTLFLRGMIVSGIISFCVGAMFLLVQVTGMRRRRRTALLGQEDLLTAEFQAARSVQQSLLPEEDAQIFGFDLSGTTAPAVEIGGDYYDYLTFADGTKGIVVADAAGKGIPAALVMAKFQGMAQALSIHVSNPEEFFVGLNDTLRIRLGRRSFITVGMLTIDFDDHLAFYRAGHSPLVVYRSTSNTVDSLQPPGMALGLAHGTLLGNSMRAEHFEMESGDVALLYSDGLTEATNTAGEEYGEQRVADSIRRAAARQSTAATIRSTVLNDLATFVGTAEPHDDVTVVVVKKS